VSKPPDYRVLGPGHYSLLVEGRSYEVFVREEKNGYRVEVDGHLIPVRSPQVAVVSEKAEGNGPETITSPMPGRVILVKVKEGDSVKAGEGLVVVSAMKMENELVATRSGKVARIAVKEGETVEAGQELVWITKKI